jgi:RhtB (resistance to homoserine/threonine) family protein
MVDSSVLAFTGIAFLVTITPGADTMLVMRSVLARGPRAGLLTTIGICCGLFIHATLSAVGLSLILVRSAAAFEIVKLAGAAYLILLGIQSISRVVRHQPSVVDNPPLVRSYAARSTKRRAFLEGLLSNVLNPKVAVFYLAFLPQFIMPGDPVLLKSMLLAGIHFVLGLLWLSLVTLLLGRVRAVLTRPHIQQRLEAITGAILIAFGVRLALERR